MNRGFKFRIFPNKKQENLLQKSFGCNRLIYNLLLDYQIKRYENKEKHLSEFDMNSYISNDLLKDDNYYFLKEVDNYCLKSASKSLNDSYQRFFKKQTKFPKFHSKHKSKKSYTTYSIRMKIIDDSHIFLSKLKTIKCEFHQKLPKDYKIKSATISQDAKGNYYCSFCLEYENQVLQKDWTNNIKILGLDYKSDGLYMDSEGTNCSMPKFFRKSQKKLKKLQRRLSRKIGSKKDESKSKNWLKQNLKVNKLYGKIANQRKDYLHKESRLLANFYDIICVEDINMKNLANKGFGNGKATNDNGYGMFRSFLQYKLEDQGKLLIKVDKFYSSSQICSNCGHKQKMPLDVRTYNCPKCGLELDRDFNAAINIRNEGLRIFKEQYCS